MAQEDAGTREDAGSSSGEEDSSDGEGESADTVPYMTITTPAEEASAPSIDDGAPVDDFGNSITSAPVADPHGLQPLRFTADVNVDAADGGEGRAVTGVTESDSPPAHPADQTCKIADAAVEDADVAHVAAVTQAVSLDGAADAAHHGASDGPGDHVHDAQDTPGPATRTHADAATEGASGGTNVAETGDRDDVLADLATGNRELRAFRDYVHEENVPCVCCLRVCMYGSLHHVGYLIRRDSIGCSMQSGPSPCLRLRISPGVYTSGGLSAAQPRRRSD